MIYRRPPSAGSRGRRQGRRGAKRSATEVGDLGDRKEKRGGTTHHGSKHRLLPQRVLEITSTEKGVTWNETGGRASGSKNWFNKAAAKPDAEPGTPPPLLCLLPRGLPPVCLAALLRVLLSVCLFNWGVAVAWWLLTSNERTRPALSF
jgi:hypothetical protein